MVHTAHLTVAVGIIAAPIASNRCVVCSIPDKVKKQLGLRSAAIENQPIGDRCNTHAASEF